MNCQNLERWSGTSRKGDRGQTIVTVSMRRDGERGSMAVSFDLSKPEEREAYFRLQRPSQPEQLRAAACDAQARMNATWFGVDGRGDVYSQTLAPGCRPKGGNGITWYGTGEEGSRRAQANSRLSSGTHLSAAAEQAIAFDRERNERAEAAMRRAQTMPSDNLTRALWESLEKRAWGRMSSADWQLLTRCRQKFAPQFCR
jgi:hypothetical protein